MPTQVCSISLLCSHIMFGRMCGTHETDSNGKLALQVTLSELEFSTDSSEASGLVLRFDLSSFAELTAVELQFPVGDTYQFDLLLSSDEEDFEVLITVRQSLRTLVCKWFPQCVCVCDGLFGTWKSLIIFLLGVGCCRSKSRHFQRMIRNLTVCFKIVQDLVQETEGLVSRGEGGGWHPFSTGESLSNLWLFQVDELLTFLTWRTWRQSHQPSHQPFYVSRPCWPTVLNADYRWLLNSLNTATLPTCIDDRLFFFILSITVHPWKWLFIVYSMNPLLCLYDQPRGVSWKKNTVHVSSSIPTTKRFRLLLRFFSSHGKFGTAVPPTSERYFSPSPFSLLSSPVSSCPARAWKARTPPGGKRSSLASWSPPASPLRMSTLSCRGLDRELTDSGCWTRGLSVPLWSLPMILEQWVIIGWKNIFVGVKKNGQE